MKILEEALLGVLGKGLGGIKAKTPVTSASSGASSQNRTLIFEPTHFGPLNKGENAIRSLNSLVRGLPSEFQRLPSS